MPSIKSMRSKFRAANRFRYLPKPKKQNKMLHNKPKDFYDRTPDHYAIQPSPLAAAASPAHSIDPKLDA